MTVQPETAAPVQVVVQRVDGPQVAVTQTAPVQVSAQRLDPVQVAVQLPGLPGPAGPMVEAYTYAQPGSTQVFLGTSRIYLERPCQLLTLRAALGVPSAGDVIVVLRRNGTSWQQLVLPAGEPTVVLDGPLALAAGDWLTVDVAPVLAGSGADLTVTVRVAS